MQIMTKFSLGDELREVYEWKFIILIERIFHQKEEFIYFSN
jgi:hypothetical protein